MEPAAQVSGHRHETPVGAVSRHVLKLRFFGEADHRAVRHRVRPRHPEITAPQQHESLFHHVYTPRHIGHPRGDHVWFVEVQKIDAGFGHEVHSPASV